MTINLFVLTKPKLRLKNKKKPFNGKAHKNKFHYPTLFLVDLVSFQYHRGEDNRKGFHYPK